MSIGVNSFRGRLKVFVAHRENWPVIALPIGTGAGAWISGGWPSFALGAWPALGIVLFTANEYTLHRFLLHMPVPDPTRHPWLFARYHRLHYGHHQEPTDIPLLFAPLWFSFPMSALNFLAIGTIFSFLPSVTAKPWSTAAALLTGSFATLVYYEWVHMIAHLPGQPAWSFQRFMKRWHLWHHYRSEKHWFGVTNPVFDFLQGTSGRPESVPQSETARNLGGIDPEGIAASV